MKCSTNGNKNQCSDLLEISLFIEAKSDRPPLNTQQNRQNTDKVDSIFIVWPGHANLCSLNIFSWTEKIITSFWADQNFTAKLVTVASNKRNYKKKAESKWIGSGTL